MTPLYLRLMAARAEIPEPSKVVGSAENLHHGLENWVYSWSCLDALIIQIKDPWQNVYICHRLGIDPGAFKKLSACFGEFV